MYSLAVILAVVCAAAALPHPYRVRRDIGIPKSYRPPAYRAPAPQYYAPAPAPAAPAPQFYSAPAASPKQILILRQTQENNFDGTFNYDFEAENGIASSANGYVKAISPEEQGQVMQGTYTYTAPDGTPITTRWFADETGFHAEGAHLPVPPPVPEAIAKSLAYQAAAPAPAPAHGRAYRRR